MDVPLGHTVGFRRVSSFWFSISLRPYLTIFALLPVPHMLRIRASRSVSTLLYTPKKAIRNGQFFSTSVKPSPTETLLTALSGTQPRFNLPGTNVKVLRTPREYYGNLIVRYATPARPGVLIELMLRSEIGHDQTRQATYRPLLFVHWNS